MKHLIILIFIGFVSVANGQKPFNTDPSLKFDQRVSRCEKKWVITPKADTASRYHYGYVYMDEQAGLTFDLRGSFRVDDKGQYIPDPVLNKYAIYKYRVAPNWAPAALLPPKHFDELKIQAEPDWVKGYYHTVTDSLAYNFRMGFNYNVVNDCEMALAYLNKVYKVNPHYKGLEFELAFAYNVLNRFDDAIKLIEPALKNDRTNTYFYKELGYAFTHKKMFDKAIATYKAGLAYLTEPSETKGEMAANMADCYKALGNIDEYKNWMIKGKEYTPPTSSYYGRFAAAGF